MLEAKRNSMKKLLEKYEATEGVTYENGTRFYWYIYTLFITAFL